MSTANRVVKNTGYLYAKMAITMFISLYTTRLILNSLGASDFGIFNIVGGSIAMLGFLQGAMAGATQRFVSYAEGAGDQEGKKKIFNSSILLHVLISLFVGIVLEIAAIFFFNGILSIPEERMYAAKFIYHCAVITTMLTIQAVPFEAMINAHENMLYYAVVGILESLLKLTVAIIVVYTLVDKLIVYGLLMAVIALIMRSLMGWYCHKHYEECKFKPTKYIDKSVLKKMTSFAGWNATSTITSVVSQYGNGIVLNHFFGTIVNAAQGVTNQISGQFGSLTTQARKALNPVIVKSVGAKNYALMFKSVCWGDKVMFFLTSIFFLPILANLKPVLVLWLKNPPEYTYIFVTLYLTVNMLNTLASCLPVAISAIGKIREYQLSVSVTNFIPLFGGIILFSCGLPPYSIYVLMIISTTLQLILRSYFAYKICKFSTRMIVVEHILRCAAAFGVAFIAAWLLNKLYTSDNIIILLCIIVADILIYALVYFYIAFNTNDRIYVISKVKEAIDRLKIKGRK